MKRYVQSNRYSNQIVGQDAFIVRYALDEPNHAEYETLVYAISKEDASARVERRILDDGYVISSRKADDDDIAEFNEEINKIIGGKS